MLNGSLFVLVILVAVIAGIVIGFVLRQLFAEKKMKLSESLAERIVEESKKEAETIKKEAILQAKENLLKIKADFDRETKDKKNDLDGLEKRIRAKEENLDKRIDSLAQKESNIEDEAKFTADRKSREIIAYSIQRYAGDVVAENTVSAVNLPSEEMKGRIIGREGRNIRAVEAATGIELIIR